MKNLNNSAIIIFLFICLFLSSSVSDAHRPLTTQSAYPVDVHRVKVESGIRYFNYPDGHEAYNIDMEINYGVVNNLDVGVEIPYIFWRPKEANLHMDAIGDMILKARLLFLKGRPGNPISMTVQPFFKVPTPEDDKDILKSGPGFSTGETDFGFLLIATRESLPLIAHLNLGYTFTNRPSFGPDYKNIFTFRLALEYNHDKRLKLLGELTGETNKNPSDDDIFSILFGTRYRLNDDAWIDAAYSLGLADSKSGPDSTATMGITVNY